MTEIAYFCQVMISYVAQITPPHSRRARIILLVSAEKYFLRKQNRLKWSSQHPFHFSQSGKYRLTLIPVYVCRTHNTWNVKC